MKTWRRIFFFIVLLGIILIGGFAYGLFSGNDKAAQNLVISSGQGVNQVSADLKAVGLIKSKLVFETWLWLLHSENRVVAGAYNLPADISIYRLVNLITSLPVNQQQSILLPEGLDRQMIADILDKKGLSGDDFLSVTKKIADWQLAYDFLADAPKNATLEGYIFPDTYFVDNYTTIIDFIDKTLNNFDKKLTAGLRQEIKNQRKTIFAVVTLASIIEREVPNDQDKKMIADIFLKRLKIGMALQSDATINFITGKGLVQPTAKDLAVDSPYNTYKNPGLPPGPISNPGIKSIEAVLYPTDNPYYYFLTTKEGKVIYSKTYQEHLKNKAKYLD
ncbi:MAG: endolytic transglycosylase MltG [Patescibacteria group bacterium]